MVITLKHYIKAIEHSFKTLTYLIKAILSIDINSGMHILCWFDFIDSDSKIITFLSNPFITFITISRITHQKTSFSFPQVILNIWQIFH